MGENNRPNHSNTKGGTKQIKGDTPNVKGHRAEKTAQS